MNERIESSAMSEAKARELLDQMTEALLENPINITPEQSHAYSVAVSEAVPELEQLMHDPQHQEEAIRNLIIISYGYSYAEDGDSALDISDIDKESGQRAVEILFKNKELILELALKEKRHPRFSNIVRLEKVPGYEEEMTNYLAEEIGKAGLDLTVLEAAWSQAGFEDRNDSYRILNIFQLLRLEREVPGAALELFNQFGIADFARYPLDALITQYEQRENIETPYGIMLYPRSDWNGAFYNDVDMIREFSDSLGDTAALRFVECESKIDIARQLLSLQQKYEKAEGGHKISFAVICGHGNRELMDFGGKDERHRLNISDLSGQGIARTKAFFEDDATLVLFSCTTGEEGGLGQQLSGALELTVIAPDGITSPTSITYEQEREDFSVAYHGGINTKVYKNGEDITKTQ